jgi:hypothetical protein
MDTAEKELKQGVIADCYNNNNNPLPLQIRRDWLQASRRLDCKPRDSLEPSGKTRKRKEVEGGDLDGGKTYNENFSISNQGNRKDRWGCEKTPP